MKAVFNPEDYLISTEKLISNNDLSLADKFFSDTDLIPAGGYITDDALRQGTGLISSLDLSLTDVSPMTEGFWLAVFHFENSKTLE